MRNEAKQAGFSLLELMITVLIVGVLAAIAYPLYQRQVVEGRRAAAAACTLEMAQFMERYFSTNLSYVGAILPDTTCETELAPFYRFGFVAAPTATQYEIEAERQGVQADRDVDCGELRIDQAGRKTVTSGDEVRCWN